MKDIALFLRVVSRKESVANSIRGEVINSVLGLLMKKFSEPKRVAGLEYRGGALLKQFQQ